MNCQPPGFSPAGQVDSAYLSKSPPPFLRQRRYSGRRAEGVRYERKVQEHLQALFPETYMPSPWFRFQSEGKWRWCQPDGLLIDLAQGKITCVEVKYSHTVLAWWQTRRLYMPVLEKCFPPHLWRFEVCEVVKWYDPAIQLPEPHILAAEVDQVSEKFKVHIWKP